MERLTKTILLLVGLVNFLPVVGVLSAERLANLYGIAVPGDDLLILLRHRALLFGVLGGFIIYSAFRRHLRPAAVTIGFISMIGFIVVLLVLGDYGDKLRIVAIVDAVAIFALAIVAGFVYRNSNGS